MTAAERQLLANKILFRRSLLRWARDRKAELVADRIQKDRLAAVLAERPRGRSGLSWMSKGMITNGLANPSLRTRMDDKGHMAGSIHILPSRIATGTTHSQWC
jgi:hypothetical protein